MWICAFANCFDGVFHLTNHGCTVSEKNKLLTGFIVCFFLRIVDSKRRTELGLFFQVVLVIAGFGEESRTRTLSVALTTPFFHSIGSRYVPSSACTRRTRVLEPVLLVHYQRMGS